MEIKDDGTQTLTFKIPKYFYGEVPNTRLTNPRWKDVETGVLAENTRVLKVFIQFKDTVKVFPFMIDKIVNKRDGSFSVYKEVTGNGLAFAELGKIGYKLELTSDVLEDDFKNDSTVVANINYWLDKVFPNVKDDAGNVLRWLTPWSYEIRMDWRGYFQDPSDFIIDGGSAVNWQDRGFMFYNSKGMAATLNNKDKNWLLINGGTSAKMYQIRDEEVIYEDAYVADWTVSNGTLTPLKVSSFEEKARYVNCSNSNKYNITQSIAEAFGVFCSYEYEVDQHGYFKGTYWDEIGRVWTGKRVVFYNRAVKTDEPFTINYEHNLSTISREIDSSEIYSKLYVVPLESELMDTGFVTIADTPSNPLLDDFILNFDYLHEIGSVTDEQYEWIEKTYKPSLHDINKSIALNEEKYNDTATSLNELEAQLQTAKNELLSAQEQLGNYQQLRDNDTFKEPVEKNESNGYTVTFVPQTASNINLATFRVTGIDASCGIACYNNSKYEHNPTDGHYCLFSSFTTEKDALGNTVNADKPIFVKGYPGQAAAMPNSWFIVTDEDGFPTQVYSSLETPSGSLKSKAFQNFTTGAICYFKLTYWPKNKYTAVCARFEAEIKQKEDLIGSLEDQVKEKEELLEIYEATRKKLLDDKDDLNYKFERLLGPAVREGYWQAEGYEDPGQGYNLAFSMQNNHPEADTYFMYDYEPFEEEQLNKYLIAETVDNNAATTGYTYKYYPYIDLSPICDKDQTIMDNVEEFVIELEHPQFESEITEADGLAASTNYKLIYNSDFYYYKLPQTLPKGSHLYICITDKVKANSSVREIVLKYSLPNSTAKNSISWISNPDKSLVWVDTTSRFSGLQQFLGVRSLFNNAGYVLAFMDTNGDENGAAADGSQNIIPIALLTSTDINYESYTQVSVAASATSERVTGATNPTTGQYETFSIKSNQETKYPVVYPRIFIDKKNVNYNSDNLVIHCSALDTVDESTGDIVEDGAGDLVKYEDYRILLRKGKPYITFKITNANLIRYLMFYDYSIIYQVSRANEMLYLDARQVAKDNSKPKYSYEVEIGNVPDEMNSIELGQLIYVCDHTVDASRERGYVSELKYQLDQPSKDSFVIANYKTKFEDLFSSLTAQNEAMKQNQTAYNIAAQAFNSNGEIAQETLQQTLDNTEAQFTFGNNSITLDRQGGMVITNQNAYRNGVYGQIKLSAGGIYCSDTVDNTGERIWSTGITPQGINASLITAGQIDTKYIRILSGDQTRFQWNESGLYAFADDTTATESSGKINLDVSTFVRFNEEGLLFQKNNQRLLSLDWTGLHIGAQDDAVRITSENGFEVCNQSGKRLVQLGRHTTASTDAASQYGLAMYNTSGNKTLYTDQNGNLHLTGKLTIGSGEGFVCLNGAASSDTDFVLYAGSESPMSAEFALRKDGKIYSKGQLVDLVPTTTA